jgi:hypothetical protein
MVLAVYSALVLMNGSPGAAVNTPRTFVFTTKYRGI